MSIIDSEDRPVWGADDESDPGPHDSVIGSDEERMLTNRMADAQAAAQVEALRRERRMVPYGPPAGPVLSPADAPRVTALAADLIRETRGRERFLAFPEDEFSAAAAILVRFRARSLGTIQQTRKDARTLFLRDLAACFWIPKTGYHAGSGTAEIPGYAAHPTDSRPFSPADAPSSA